MPCHFWFSVSTARGLLPATNKSGSLYRNCSVLKYVTHQRYPGNINICCDFCGFLCLTRFPLETIHPRSQARDLLRATRSLIRIHNIHAKNTIAGRITPILVRAFVLDFWDKNTGMCTGAMPYRRALPATTRIYAFQA